MASTIIIIITTVITIMQTISQITLQIISIATTGMIAVPIITTTKIIFGISTRLVYLLPAI